jgi:hypothetical protein
MEHLAWKERLETKPHVEEARATYLRWVRTKLV